MSTRIEKAESSAKALAISNDDIESIVKRVVDLDYVNKLYRGK